MNIEVGKEYLVNHSRKGKFRILVSSVSEEWISGTITKGKAGAILSYNEVEQGEEITIRRSHCVFTEVSE